MNQLSKSCEFVAHLLKKKGACSHDAGIINAILAHQIVISVDSTLVR